MERYFFLKIENYIFYRGDVFLFLFDSFEIYQIVYLIDLIGLVIELLYFIVVFLGNDCNKIDGIGFCDYFIIQLFLMGFVDNMYIVFFNNDDRGIIICIIVIEKLDIFYVIGVVNKSLFLYKYNLFDIWIFSNQVCYIKFIMFVIVMGIGLVLK